MHRVAEGSHHVRSPQSGPRVELTAIAHTPVRSASASNVGAARERVRLVGRVLQIESIDAFSLEPAQVGGRPAMSLAFASGPKIAILGRASA